MIDFLMGPGIEFIFNGIVFWIVIYAVLSIIEGRK